MRSKPRHRRPLSIGVIFFVILACIALLAGASVSVWRGKQTYDREQQARAVSGEIFSHTLARSVNIFLSLSVKTVETMAREAEVLPSLDAKQLQPLVTRFAAQNQNTYISMYIIGTDGKEIADYFPSGVDESDQLAGIGIDLNDRSYVQSVLAEHKVVVSETVIGRSTKRPVVVIAAPIFDTNGAVIAIAAGSLNLDALAGLAVQTTNQESLRPIVVDKNGIVVVHHDPALIAALTNFGNLEPAKRSLAGETGFTSSYAELGQKTYSAAYSPVPEFGWGVWIAQDSGYATLIAWRSVRDGMISFAIILVLAGITFGATSHFLFLPLRRIAKQAEKISGGQLGGTIDLSGTLSSSEIFVLARQFDIMSKSLQDSLGMKTQFLDLISHVFRTPIGALRWQIEYQLDRGQKMDSEQKAAWMSCQRSIERLQITFDNVITAQQITRKKIDLAILSSTELTSLMKEVVQRFIILAEEKNIKIKLDTEKDVSMACDKRRIVKVFSVVLENAILYSKDGDMITIQIKEENGEAVIIVSDNGIGIKAGELSKIFTPFFRGEAAEKKFTDGTGLGLFIAKACVEAHQGKIKLSRRTSGGVEVIIRLPLDKTSS